jgi:spermidine synthase
VTVVPEVPGAHQAAAMVGAANPEQTADELVRRWSSGWGVSRVYNGPSPRSLWLQHDTEAGTPILEGSGFRPLSDFEVLQWDVSAMGYQLRRDDIDEAFVIGGGGGRDFMTALTFGAHEVDVAEINPTVIDAVQRVFADFSGKPYTRAGVHYEVGEARGILSRSNARYDVIQMSMIDTWAAAMSGAMTLSENVLYTREAFAIYRDHLADDGILTVSRWYGKENYGETARVLSLMHDTLASAGTQDPSRNVAVVATSHSTFAFGVANCMMKRTPFTDAELQTLRTVAAREGFLVLWPSDAPVSAESPMDAGAILRDGGGVTDRFDLRPPTDDRPFFFNLAPPVASWIAALREGDSSIGSRPTVIFTSIFLIIALVARAFVFRPLSEVEATLPADQRVDLRGALPEVAYFGGIGVAFLFVELGLFQRYILFLGHPTYAISVVLLALLLSTGVGALLPGVAPRAARLVLPLLVILLLGTAFLAPPLLEAVHAWPLAARIPLAIALVVPLGACMGVAWPTGVAGLSSSGRERLVPWMWAVNGVGGTFASVVGMAVATAWGYTALLLLGAAGYVVSAALVRRLGWASNPLGSPQ